MIIRVEKNKLSDSTKVQISVLGSTFPKSSQIAETFDITLFVAWVSFER